MTERTGPRLLRSVRTGPGARGRLLEKPALFFFSGGVLAVKYGQILTCSLLLTALILAGCSDPPEAAAAKKISTNLAQARELMKDQTLDSYSQAESLLRSALKTPAAILSVPFSTLNSHRRSSSPFVFIRVHRCSSVVSSLLLFIDGHRRFQLFSASFLRALAPLRAISPSSPSPPTLHSHRRPSAPIGGSNSPPFPRTWSP